MAGHSVHERLNRLDIKLAGSNWSDEEDVELRRLYEDGNLALHEIALQLGRTHAGIACRANELKIRKLTDRNRRKVPRGKGYDKATMKKYIKAFEQYKGPLTKYCRSNSIHIETFAVAAQRHFPEWWDEYSEGFDLEAIVCSNRDFYPTNARQEFCTRKCSEGYRRDRDYFGGQRRHGEGIAENICQVCLKPILKGTHAHHIYGKANDPENQFLAAMHSGCHLTLERLAQTTAADDPQMWIRLMKLVWLKRHGAEDFEKELRIAMVQSVADKS